MAVERSRLTWRDTIGEALAAITQRPVRTLLTAAGTILGVGAFVATIGLAETARAQVSSRFDALKATEVRIQDAAPDGTNPFPTDSTARLERLNGINHAGVYFNIPDNSSRVQQFRWLQPTRVRSWQHCPSCRSVASTTTSTKVGASVSP